MSEHFCTYFDHRYAAKGLAMWQSLKKHSPSAQLHLLCLNDACREIFAALQLTDVHLYGLDALEAVDADLLNARANRTLVEYYFTVTPCLPLYLFGACADIVRLTYVDADLFFFADPQPILDEIGDNAVGLIEHRFAEELADLEKHGRFNIGWLTFRRDPVALDCLATWRRQCLEWCYDRLEPGRFADQKYLDEWPERFERVRIVQHRGANVAPWNLNRFELSRSDAGVLVGGDPLVFYHAHGFKPRSPGRCGVFNLGEYRVQPTPLLMSAILEPYERALIDATTMLGTPFALALLSDDGFRSTASLTAQLFEVQAEGAACLDIVHRQTKELEISSQEYRAGRVDVAHALRRQLEASEADRAARLDIIQRQKKDLDICEADRAARLDVIHALQQQLEASEATQAARIANVLQPVETQLGETEAALAHTRTRLEELHRRIEQLIRSRSWRWTEPIRWVSGLLKH